MPRTPSLKSVPTRIARSISDSRVMPQVRRHAARVIAQRRAVAQADQGEKLVELTVAGDGERLSAQVRERDRLRLHDRGQDDAHRRDRTAPAASPAGHGRNSVVG
jgi:hypothetical protein